jgi:serine/threonine protein kinase
MSPHLQAQKDYTCKADVWSLGIALFEIITVERPFKGRKKEEYYLSIHKPIEYPDFVKNEKDLIYIIELMLRVEQDERPTIDFIIEQLYLVINVNNNMETLMRKYNLTYNEILSYSYQSNFNLTRLEESFNGNTSNSE